MSHPHSRKTFFAKLLGISAAIGLMPRLLAKPVSSTANAVATQASVPGAPGSGRPGSGGLGNKTPAFILRPDPRAIARTAGAE
ncbi:hypothetical protein Ga0100231_004740 [Opitutaceae bacterium TAV4]|uniref:hypothetical protein n=1 Tax=Geminisphaera colitermitum TaxID=1148786 RepID=UPI0005BCC23C|nr:hypothetical protein [Geminisphaera colitermitum]RRJ97774.1 hypothetical protein Ga0100231_004740 [Opitutaceae bacterium TAV4]